MKEVFRIKLEALNFGKIYHTVFSDDLEHYPNNDTIKKFIEDYRSKYGNTTCQAQVVKIYLLDY